MKRPLLVAVLSLACSAWCFYAGLRLGELVATRECEAQPFEQLGVCVERGLELERQLSRCRAGIVEAYEPLECERIPGTGGYRCR